MLPTAHDFPERVQFHKHTMGVSLKRPQIGSCFLDHETRETTVESSGIFQRCHGSDVSIWSDGDCTSTTVDPVCRVSQVPTATERDVDLVNEVPE